MTKERLGTFIQEYSVKNKKDLGYPVYSVTNSQGFCTEYFNKDVSGEDKTNYKIVPKGYFAYNPSRINVGSIDWQNCEDNVIVSPLYVVFKCSEGLNQDYLKYYLKSANGRRIINAKASVAVRSSLKFNVLSDFELNIGSIEEQLEVVNVLKKIEHAIEEEYHQLRLLDELIKTRFYETFGDVKVNEYKWKKCTFNDLTVKITDGEHGTVPRVEKDEGFLYFMARNITKDGEIDLSETSYVPEDVHHKIYKRCTPQANDILLVCVGATIGKCAVVPECMGEFSMARSVALLKPDCQKVCSPFFINLLRSDSVQREIVHCAHTAAQPGLYTNMIKGLKAFLPPLELQEQFSEFCGQVNKSRIEIQKRINLYRELLVKKTDELFKGEGV